MEIPVTSKTKRQIKVYTYKIYNSRNSNRYRKYKLANRFVKQSATRQGKVDRQGMTVAIRDDEIEASLNRIIALVAVMPHRDRRISIVTLTFDFECSFYNSRNLFSLRNNTKNGLPPKSTTVEICSASGTGARRHEPHRIYNSRNLFSLRNQDTWFSLLLSTTVEICSASGTGRPSYNPNLSTTVEICSASGTR